MGSLQDLLKERMSSSENSGKMQALARASRDGELSSIVGIFGKIELSEGEKTELHNLLERYSQEGKQIARQDFDLLVNLTQEVKAINHQAVLLHGERIKRAQELLKKYQDGAFTAWLVATYGNRQTPYNFLQYFELYSKLPKELKPKAEAMPRQAIYSLASRQVSPDAKIEFIKRYAGQTKQEALELIQKQFPLHKQDKRQADVGQKILTGVESALHLFLRNQDALSDEEIEMVKAALEKFLFHTKNAL